MLFLIEMRILILICVFSTIISVADAQDTIFVNKHAFNNPVQNIFKGNEKIYVKTSQSVYELNDGEWEVLDLNFSKPYVFFKEGFYESDFIPNSEVYDISLIKELVPQRGKFIATSARKGSRFFIATGSALFEYEIRDFYTRSYANHSIRDIYIDDSLKFIATYSGLFVNDSIRLTSTNYSNGPLVKIDSVYYLPWDEVSILIPPDSLVLTPIESNSFTGKARKIIPYQGQKFGLFTRAVCKILDGFELQSFHQGLEYLDLETFQGSLIVSSEEGLCLALTENSLDTLAQLPATIKDVYPSGEFLYLASDVGVYRLNGLDATSLVKIADVPRSVMVQIDDFNHLWIASENGLYVFSDDFPEPIAIITDVEFNREALLLHNEELYVGGINGLYTLNTYEMAKSHIPQLLNQLNTPKLIENKWIWANGLLLVFIGAFIGYFFWKKRNNANRDSQNNKDNWDLVALQHHIINEKLLTVEALAEYLETNPVQLNRNFKKFGITPGKFLKKVKLKQAKIMLKEGQSIEEVAKYIGYSTKFLKDELDS